MGTFTVRPSLFDKARKNKSPEEFKEQLYKDWVRYSRVLNWR